jgi:hypothetical protein
MESPDGYAATIQRLYRLQELANVKHLEPEERALQRRGRSSEVLSNLRRRLIPIVATEPPGSDITRAAAYCLNQWNALTRFLEDAAQLGQQSLRAAAPRYCTRTQELSVCRLTRRGASNGYTA